MCRSRPFVETATYALDPKVAIAKAALLRSARSQPEAGVRPPP